MSRLLDLQLEIVATRSSEMTTSAINGTFTLRCDALALKQAGELFTYPLTPQERNDLRWYLEEYYKWPFEGFALRGSLVEQLLPALGQRLYQAVFGQETTGALLRIWRANRARNHQISIITSDPGTLSLPWELLHDGKAFLALQDRPSISIVRRLVGEAQPVVQTRTFRRPLRVLLITARPLGTAYVDARTVARELLDALQEQIETGTIEVEFLRPPTLDALRARLADTKRPIHILHFDGHGVFGTLPQNMDEARGRLLFEAKSGLAELVDAGKLGALLHKSGVRIVVLNACQSAVIGANDIFSSAAVQLLQGNIQSVIAMSASVLTTSAALYVKALYETLAQGGSVQKAHEQAQQRLYENPARNPLQHHLDEAGKSVNLQDWWLPYLYLQQPLVLRPVKRRSKKQLASEPVPVQREERLALSRYPFNGRSAELLHIERSLLSKKVVVISGFGGVGKTTLAREAVDWLVRTAMYKTACLVSFEHGGDASLLLSVLGQVLKISSGNYHPYDSSAALVVLGPLLKQQRLLIIVDNIESVLSGSETSLDETGLEQLWNVLNQLREMGVGILLTSRSATLDKRWFTSSRAENLALKGLAPGDAYTLATQVLNDLRLDLARFPYGDLLDLLAQLDYHPLAVQLTLPALRDRSLAQVRADFSSLLSTFKDDQEHGRNRSLLASLDYSFQHFSDKQRALLPLLSVFEGGALELNLLNITEMPLEEWNNLRQVLEQTGLLVQEIPYKGIKMNFQHFHPTLTPYLRSQPGADDPALRERYTTNYYQFAYYLSTRDQDKTEIMRAWTRVELPNLRRMLYLLLRSDEVELITAVADILMRFLDYFGRQRERSALRRTVLAAIGLRDASGDEIETLTWQVYWQEKNLGEQELERGDWSAAVRRFQALLFAIETLPEDEELGRRSLSYIVVLQHFARALKRGGRFEEAAATLQKALSLIAELSTTNELRHTRGSLLTDLGDLQRGQGLYDDAKQAYEQALSIAQSENDQRTQAVTLTQLGSLALAQKNYTEALNLLIDARTRFQKLEEKALEATVWHQMGVTSMDLALQYHSYRLAQPPGSAQKGSFSLESEQEVLIEAEQAYRESLKLRDQLGDEIAAAETCFQLGLLATRTARLGEARDWYERALEVFQRLAPGTTSHLAVLSGLAHLFSRDDYPDRQLHLAEACALAEQALTLAEQFSITDRTWTLYRTLASLASLQGREADAEDYRRREREVYAAFLPHRNEMQKTFGTLITNAISAAGGDEQARAEIEPILVLFASDSASLHFVEEAIRRIWLGERNWHALARKMISAHALIILLILEGLTAH